MNNKRNTRRTMLHLDRKRVAQHAWQKCCTSVAMEDAFRYGIATATRCATVGERKAQQPPPYKGVALDVALRAKEGKRMDFQRLTSSPMPIPDRDILSAVGRA